ncbi:hypothetical protein [Psychrobacillus sp. FSL H8-0487]|uniref:hypothetical protein n=1 Tax=Psychrobacillus sp. FSL H8-0487 TaxID=2921391 RepID=UPI0030FB0737
MIRINKLIAINKTFFIILLTILSLMSIAGCGMADGGKVTAREVLKQNSDADILMYKGRIYSNMTEVEWFEQKKEEYIKYNLIGEIDKQSTNSIGFNDMTATKLPVGTKVHSSREVDNDKELGILIVEFEGEYLYYMQLLEG